ncbi:MAG: hypothetical protein ACRDGR_10285 [bacterium]
MQLDRSRALSALVTNSVLAVGFLALCYWLCYERPVEYVQFVARGSWVDLATFAAYVLAGVGTLWLAARDATYRKVGWLGLAAGALFAAGDEVRWGRIAQSASAGENPAGAGPAILFFGVVMFAVVVPLLPRVSRRLAALYPRIGVPVVPGRVLPLFLLAASILHCHAVKALPERQELMQLCLATAFTVMAADLLVRSQGGARTGATAPVWAAVGAVALTWIGTIPLARWSGPSSFDADLNRYAAFRFPSEGLFRQAETVFRYLGSHPEARWDDTVLNQAIVYRRSARNAEAEQVLRNALAEKEELQRARPSDPVPFRDAGRILALLGESSAAAAALEAAAGLDVARLPAAMGGPEEWAVHWSLGKTYHAMGYRDAAREEIERAMTLAPDAPTRERISGWFSWEERRRALLDADGSGRGSGPVAIAS